MRRPQPIGPLLPGFGRAWQQSREARLDEVLDVVVEGTVPTRGTTLVVATPAGALEAEVLRHVWPGPLATLGRDWALRRGTSALVWAHAGQAGPRVRAADVAPAIAAAQRRRVELRCVVVEGSEDLPSSLLGIQGRPRVVVRLAPPIAIDRGDDAAALARRAGDVLAGMRNGRDLA